MEWDGAMGCGCAAGVGRKARVGGATGCGEAGGHICGGFGNEKSDGSGRLGWEHRRVGRWVVGRRVEAGGLEL